MKRSSVLVMLMLLVACGTNNTNPTGAALDFLTRSLQPAFVGETYSQPVQLTSGTRPYLLKVSKGVLPAGLQLNDRSITGVPKEAKSYQFTLEASDANLSNRVQEFTLEVRVAPPASLDWKAPQTAISDETRIPFLLKGAKKIKSFKVSVPLPEGMSVLRLEAGQGKPIMLSKLGVYTPPTVLKAPATPSPATAAVTTGTSVPSGPSSSGLVPNPTETKPVESSTAASGTTAPGSTASSSSDAKPSEGPSSASSGSASSGPDSATPPSTTTPAQTTPEKPIQVLRIDGALTEAINTNREITLFYLVVKTTTPSKLEGRIGFELRANGTTISSLEMTAPVTPKSPTPATPTTPTAPTPATPTPEPPKTEPTTPGGPK